MPKLQQLLLHGLPESSRKMYKQKSLSAMDTATLTFSHLVHYVQKVIGATDLVIACAIQDIHYQGKKLQEAAAPIGYH